MKRNEPRLTEVYPTAGKSRPHSGYSRLDRFQVDGIHPPMHAPLWVRAANWLVFLGTVLMVAGFVAFAFACAAMARWGLWPQ